MEKEREQEVIKRSFEIISQKDSVIADMQTVIDNLNITIKEIENVHQRKLKDVHDKHAVAEKGYNHKISELEGVIAQRNTKLKEAKETIDEKDKIILENINTIKVDFYFNLIICSRKTLQFEG